MGTPSPELKQLWIRVLKRVHPDLAIDEQDRVRCERLTKLANAAYQAGDEEALRAVLRPSQPAANAGARQAYTRSRRGQKVSPPPHPPAKPKVQQGSPAPSLSPKRSFISWFSLSNVPPLTAFSFKQLLPVAIAVVILIWTSFSLYSVTTSRHTVTNSPTAHVVSVKAPIHAHVEVSDAGISTSPQVVWSRDSKPDLPELESIHGSRHHCRSVTRSSPPKTSPPVANSVEPSHLYMEQMRERLYQSFSNYERVDANVPPGNSAEMWFDVNRDGSLSNVRVGKPSGWDSLDYACMRAVQRTETVGALPEDYKLRALPATFACTYTGSNALRTSKSVDSATDRPDLYVGSVRDTTHE